MQRGPRFPRNALLIAVAVALVLAGTYVVVTLKPAAQSSGVKVLTTFYPVYDYTRNIGGDRINVSLLVPMTLDVHAFEPTPSSVQAVATASVLIYNGAGLEPWIRRSSTSRRTPPPGSSSRSTRPSPTSRSSTT